MNTGDAVQRSIEIFLRLTLLSLLIGWCIMLLYPFTGVMLWAIVLAVATAPLYLALSQRLGGRNKLAATILVFAGLLVIALPTWLFLDSLVAGIQDLTGQFEAGELTIPPPEITVKEWPLIGEDIYVIWYNASTNLEQTLREYRDPIAEYGSAFAGQLLGIGGSLLQLVLATIIAGILLVARGTEDRAKVFFHKIVGNKGDEFTQIIQKTVNNVVRGVLGVAIIQATAIGLGFLLAGVPYAGLWTLLVLILAILQLPPSIVVVPVVIYLFSVMGTIPAILWTIYLVAAGASDSFLKAIFLGKGAPVPMLIIFLGVIGGFMLSGFIGLFTGAIVLSLGYKLFQAWMVHEPGVMESGG
ncbi:MAG TPA: AI-2E family transporter [Flavobacteriales bacterium]|jgi:predicted PurR-regulated permease PerM|nr:AI-2E family transporter [Flavobacteriales bacterium]